MKVLFVVHRYAPYPGGSEYNVQNMAEELLKRNHDVTVLAHEHKGDYNGVKVTNDYQRLTEQWDMIIVHGGDVISQNIVHVNAEVIPSPVLYLIIKPSESPVCMKGLMKHRFIGYSTSMDLEHIRKWGVGDKGRFVRYGIPVVIAEKTNETRDKKIFVSIGGFGVNKAMGSLAYAFTKANIPNAELHLYGYCEQHLMPADSHNVKCIFGKEKSEVLSAMANADAYIMNSYEEGYGIVLLEAMMNKTPWFARDIAAAHDLSKYGTVYNKEDELIEHLRNFKRDDKKINEAFDYVMANHDIHETVNDIENVLLEVLK